MSINNVFTTPTKSNDCASTSIESECSVNIPLISEQFEECEQIKILQNERNRLKKSLEEKEETLRKLNMVKLYRNKVWDYFHMSAQVKLRTL